jgi:hypothetical protein
MTSLRVRSVLFASLFVVGCGSSSHPARDGSTDGKGNDGAGDVSPTPDASDANTTPDAGPDVADASAESPDAAADMAPDVADTAPDVAADTAPDASPDGTPDAGPPVATIFLPHGTKNAVYRYNISPGVDPVLNATLPATTPAGLTMGTVATRQELFVALTDGSILRFATPLATPTANGKLDTLGVTDPEEIAFVDDELWIPTTSYTSCATTASKITRVTFDTAGAATAAGTVQAAGIVIGGRGLLWNAPSRTLYVSDCHATDTIQPFHVANDHAVTPLTAVTGGDLNNPHGMVIAPWGELLVSNAGANQVLRFTIDAQGKLTANGNLSGNGLSAPVGLTLTPWDELVVVNQGSGTLSRFTFSAADGGHAPTAAGTFATGLPATAGANTLGWILLVPSPSTAPATDGGVDASADAGDGG